jgi:hypothetical protein
MAEEEIKKEEEVEVKKPLTTNEKFDLLFGEIENLKKAGEEKDEKIKMLTETADKARMAMWDAGKPKKIVPIVKVSTIEGKLVTSWKMLKDIVKKEANGNRIELQIAEYTTEDGEKHPVNIYDVSTTIVKVPMYVIKDSIVDEETNERELVLKFDMTLIPDSRIRELFVEREGTEITINSRFVN